MKLTKKTKNHVQNLELLFNVVISHADYLLMCQYELMAHKLAEKYCNGEIDSDTYDKLTGPIKLDLKAILGPLSKETFINGDPRGYALKISDQYLKSINDKRIMTDWGGYGLIAPDEYNPLKND